mgnify:CR=1 FL=1
MQVQALGDEKYLTPSQVASLLPNTSVDSVRRWIRSGALAARVLPNGRYLVRQADAESLLAPAGGRSGGGASAGELPGQGALSW